MKELPVLDSLRNGYKSKLLTITKEDTKTFTKQLTRLITLKNSYIKSHIHSTSNFN